MMIKQVQDLNMRSDSHRTDKHTCHVQFIIIYFILLPQICCLHKFDQLISGLILFCFDLANLMQERTVKPGQASV